MVELYNIEAQKAGFAPDKMHAVEGDLVNEGSESAFSGQYDLAVMSLALHHVDDPREMISKLAACLRPGGVLIILDWVNQAKTDGMANFNHITSTSGFVEEQVQEWYEAAGLDGYKWKLFGEVSEMPLEMGGPRHAFMARGQKKASE